MNDMTATPTIATTTIWTCPIHLDDESPAMVLVDCGHSVCYRCTVAVPCLETCPYCRTCIENSSVRNWVIPSDVQLPTDVTTSSSFKRTRSLQESLGEIKRRRVSVHAQWKKNVRLLIDRRWDEYLSLVVRHMARSIKDIPANKSKAVLRYTIPSILVNCDDINCRLKMFKEQHVNCQVQSFQSVDGFTLFDTKRGKGKKFIYEVPFKKIDDPPPRQVLKWDLISFNSSPQNPATSRKFYMFIEV